MGIMNQGDIKLDEVLLGKLLSKVKQDNFYKETLPTLFPPLKIGRKFIFLISNSNTRNLES